MLWCWCVTCFLDQSLHRELSVWSGVPVATSGQQLEKVSRASELLTECLSSFLLPLTGSFYNRNHLLLPVYFPYQVCLCASCYFLLKSRPQLSRLNTDQWVMAEWGAGAGCWVELLASTVSAQMFQVWKCCVGPEKPAPHWRCLTDSLLF